VSSSQLVYSGVRYRRLPYITQDSNCVDSYKMRKGGYTIETMLIGIKYSDLNFAQMAPNIEPSVEQEGSIE
jgi:hypothetical protein